MKKIDKMYFYISVMIIMFVCQVDLLAQVYGNATVTGFANFGISQVGASTVSRFTDYATGINHATSESSRPQAMYRGSDQLSKQVSALSQSLKLSFKVSSLAKSSLINTRQGSGNSGSSQSSGFGSLGSSAMPRDNSLSLTKKLSSKFSSLKRPTFLDSRFSSKIRFSGFKSFNYAKVISLASTSKSIVKRIQLKRESTFLK